MAESNRPFHVTLAVVFQVRDGKLQVLLWQRAKEPFAGDWSLPSGYLEPGETLEQSIRRHLAGKVDVRELSHLEQLETRSDPERHPEEWQLATAYLGHRPARRRSRVARGHELAPGRPASEARVRPPRDHARGPRTAAGEALVHEHRLRARPEAFTLSELRDIYAAALGHDVSATNLQRVLVRRGVLEPTGERREPGRAGGRPAALFRFSTPKLEVTDQFAVLRPPER